MGWPVSSSLDQRRTPCQAPQPEKHPSISRQTCTGAADSSQTPSSGTPRRSDDVDTVTVGVPPLDEMFMCGAGVLLCSQRSRLRVRAPGWLHN